MYSIANSLVKVVSITSMVSTFYLMSHSKNSGMIFIPIEYDIHPNEFHTYGMNSASMTFILATVRIYG